MYFIRKVAVPVVYCYVITQISDLSYFSYFCGLTSFRGWFLLGVSHVVAAGRYLELESSEGLIRLKIKGDFFFIHISRVSAGMAGTARAWQGISLCTASPHGFLSLAVSRA